MLSKNEVIIRYLICLVLFLLTGSGVITGGLATVCGVIGTIELATALQQYSPMQEERNASRRESRAYAGQLAAARLAHHN